MPGPSLSALWRLHILVHGMASIRAVEIALNHEIPKRPANPEPDDRGAVYP